MGAPVGRFDNVCCNEAGEKLKLLLTSRSMVAASAFFRRGRGGYGTRRSFAFPYRLHQIDNFFCLGDDLKRVTNCKRWMKGLADSDHSAVIMTLRVKKKLKKGVEEQRDRLKKRDYGSLLGADEETEKRKLKFGRGVWDRIEVNGSDSNSHDRLVKALVEESMESPTLSRTGAPWYVRAAEELEEAKSERNRAVEALMRAAPGSRVDAKKRLREVRGRWRRMVRKAKSDWIEERCSVINSECIAAFECGKKAWDAIKQLKAGLQKTVASSEVPLKKKDGVVCVGAKENAERFGGHFGELYLRGKRFDESALSLSTRLMRMGEGYQTKRRCCGRSRGWTCRRQGVQG